MAVGTDIVTDAPSPPPPLAQIWTCYSGLPQQNWYYTDDNRIAITGGNQCLDVDGGAGKVQTWQCQYILNPPPPCLRPTAYPPSRSSVETGTTGNTNQVWSTGAPVNPPPVISSSSAAPPTSTSSSSAGPGPSGVPSSSGIHPFGVEGLCLSVAQPFSSGSKVLSFPCNGGAGQDWIIKRGSTKVQLRADPNYCLDAGLSPNDNNVELKVWECLAGVPQQQWYFTDDGRIAIEGGTTCVDIRDGARGPGGIAQTYQCSELSSLRRTSWLLTDRSLLFSSSREAPLNQNQFFTAKTV